MTEGLEMKAGYEVEFDVDALDRMDSMQRVDRASKAVLSGIMSPNEARQRFNLPPIDGGDRCYLQRQNWPLQQLGSAANTRRRHPGATTHDTRALGLQPRAFSLRDMVDRQRFQRGDGEALNRLLRNRAIPPASEAEIQGIAQTNGSSRCTRSHARCRPSAGASGPGPTRGTITSVFEADFSTF